MLQGLRFRVESAQYLASGGITVSMQDAVAAVCAFAGECKLGSIAVELRSPLDQFLDASGTFFDEHANSIYVAESISSDQRVLQVKTDFVFVAEGGSNAALRVVRCGIAHFTFGEDDNSPGVRQFNGCSKSGDSGADDQEIAFRRRRLHLKKWYHALD